MAVTREGTVVRIDADNDTIPGVVNVKGILYIPGTSAQVRSGNAAGMVLWENTGTTRLYDDVCFRADEGLHIDLAGASAALYIYLER